MKRINYQPKAIQKDITRVENTINAWTVELQSAPDMAAVKKLNILINQAQDHLQVLQSRLASVS